MQEETGSVVYIDLMGRLGNQMFQIANGLSYGIENNCKVYLPEDRKKRHLIFNKLPRMKKPNSLPVYEYKGLKYKKVPYNGETLLLGYFQSEDYFKSNKDVILKTFKNISLELDIRLKIDRNIRDIGCEMDITISIHVRRGDYVKLSKIHPVQDESYYRRGLLAISNKLNIDFEILKKKYKLIIFSDDIGWCKSSGMFDSFNCNFIEGNEDYIDMFLMSECKHNIIANSSFSWWGAYLNESEDKIVVSPKKWFGSNGPKSWSSIYCDKWIIV
tara:strand:- start:2629 stop:3444 length:816 start_codon:yes stop_codon:yes gene_type:complete